MHALGLKSTQPQFRILQTFIFSIGRNLRENSFSYFFYCIHSNDIRHGYEKSKLLVFSIIQNQSNVHLTEFELRFDDLKKLEIYVCT